jgi:hypothetical protein
VTRIRPEARAPSAGEPALWPRAPCLRDFLPGPPARCTHTLRVAGPCVRARRAAAWLDTSSAGLPRPAGPSRSQVPRAGPRPAGVVRERGGRRPPDSEGRPGPAAAGPALIAARGAARGALAISRCGRGRACGPRLSAPAALRARRPAGLRLQVRRSGRARVRGSGRGAIRCDALHCARFPRMPAAAAPPPPSCTALATPCPPPCESAIQDDSDDSPPSLRSESDSAPTASDSSLNVCLACRKRMRMYPMYSLLLGPGNRRFCSLFCSILLKKESHESLRNSSVRFVCWHRP